MTRNIIIVVVVLIIIVLLAYYFKSSSLSLDEKGVKLQFQDKTFHLESSVVKRTPIMLTNVNVMQHKLSDGSYFEVATVDALYEFNSDITGILKAIFQAEKLETIFLKRGVSAMQVTLKNSQVINLFVENTDSKELKIYYGVSYDEFLPIIKQVAKNDFKPLPVGGLLELPSSMTNWESAIRDFNTEIIVSMDH